MDTMKFEAKHSEIEIVSFRNSHLIDLPIECDCGFCFDPDPMAEAQTCPQCSKKESPWAELVVTDPDRLVKSLVFAAENNDDSLAHSINWFRRNYQLGKVTIGYDYEPHCFSFLVESYEGYRMNGGIIFHGLAGGKYRQSGSVQLKPTAGWSVHT